MPGTVTVLCFPLRHLCKILFFFWCIDCGNNKKWSSYSFVIFLKFFLLSVWFYVGMAGAFCFILIQLVLLIDFAHSWNESWVEKMEEGNSRCWYAGRFFVLQNIFKVVELWKWKQVVDYGEIMIFMVQFTVRRFFSLSLWVASCHIICCMSTRNIPKNETIIQKTGNG